MAATRNGVGPKASRTRWSPAGTATPATPIASVGDVCAGRPSIVADQPGIQNACSERFHGSGDATCASSPFAPAAMGVTRRFHGWQRRTHRRVVQYRIHILEQSLMIEVLGIYS